MSSVSMNNQIRLFRLPDAADNEEEEQQHQQRPSYPQFFHNDDESDDGDIRTVKTNTSLTLHSIEDNIVGQHSTTYPTFDACNQSNDVAAVFPLPTQPNDDITGITTLFPNSPFSNPTSSATVQHVVVVEDDDEDFAADDEGEVSFRTTRSSRIQEQRHCYNRSVRPKKDSFVQASSRNSTSFAPIVTDWKNESTRKVVTPPAVATTTTGTSSGSTTTRTVSSATSSQGSPSTSHDYRYNYLTDERIAIVNAGETMRCRSCSSGGNVPINRSSNQVQLSESNTNSSYENSSSCNTPSPNGKQQPFVVFNSPLNDTVVEPMLRNITKSSDMDSEDNCLSSHDNDGSPFIDDENSYSFSLGGGNVSLDASPAAANPNYKNPFRTNVPDTLSIPNRTTTSTISKTVSNQEHIVNEINGNDIDDSNWIKTSWSYLQMMARKASSPLKFTEANVTKTNIDNANHHHHHHENSTSIVDLDETIASSRRSSTNNTYNNKDNDILSLNDNGADQLTYDSSFVRNGGGVGVNYSMRDDTSTLPSRESGYDHFIIQQQQQQRNDEIKSLSDPIAMIHRSTQSTFVIAYGSNDDDEENSSSKLVSVRAMDTSKQKGQDAIEYIDIASMSDIAPNGENVDSVNVGLAENKRVSKTEQSKDSSKQRRLRRYMCGLGVVLVILLAAFAATETTCAFISCQHVGFIPFPNNRSSSNKSSVVDDESTPQQPKATPIPSAESISVVPTLTPSSLTIVRTDQTTTFEPTIGFTTEPTLQVPSTAPPTPLTSPNMSTLVLNTTYELYLAVDQYLLQYGNSSYNVTLPPIGEWDVSGIFNMTSLFSSLRNPNARYFNANLSSWNTSRLVYMRSMFYQAENFNGDITTWDTSNVIDMYQTFTSAYKFNQDISSWNVGRVQEMSNMFRNCAQFNQNIGSWNTSSAIFMQGMFRNAPSFNQDLFWDTAEVINMAEMFEDADLFDGDVSKFNTSRVTDMHNMFRHALSFTGKNGLGLWQTYNVQDASQMFFGARSFAGVGLSNWNIQSLQNPMLMFSGATSFKQDLCLNWHQPLMMLDGTLNMFAGTSCPHDDTPDPIYPSRSNTFCNLCFTSTPPVIGTLSPSGAPYTGKAFITTDELRSAVDEYMIDDSPSSYVAFQYGYPIGYWDVSFLTDFSQVFDATRNSNLLRFNADLSGWNVSNAVNMYAMFQQTISFTDPNNGLAMWDVSKVTDMSGMFASSGFAGNISAWRVNNVIDFSYFAEFTPSFDSDLSTWNVSSATDMSWMFRASKAFNSNISNWDVRNVEDFSSMFAGAKIFNQDLCSWGSKVFDLFNTSSTTLAIPLIDVRNIFVSTACPLSMEPNITSIVAGPWCTPCGW